MVHSIYQLITRRRHIVPVIISSDPLPSGKQTVCYWKLQFIVHLPIKNSDFP